MLGLGLIEGVTSLIKSGLDMFGEDDKQKAQLLLKELDIAAQQNAAQAQINANEATNPSIFVSGWRPAVGWVCGLSFFFTGLIEPMVFPWFYDTVPALKEINPPTEIMTELLFAMLGVAGLRSFEKTKGIARHR